MGTFVTGYLIVGLAVVLYVARLGRQQRRLEEQLESLQAAWQAQEDPGEPQVILRAVNTNRAQGAIRKDVPHA